MRTCKDLWGSSSCLLDAQVSRWSGDCPRRSTLFGSSPPSNWPRVPEDYQPQHTQHAQHPAHCQQTARARGAIVPHAALRWHRPAARRPLRLPGSPAHPPRLPPQANNPTSGRL